MIRMAEEANTPRPRLGYVPPVKCPQHGNSMRAGSSTPRVTYYYCRYCSFSRKVTRPG